MSASRTLARALTIVAGSSDSRVTSESGLGCSR